LLRLLCLWPALDRLHLLARLIRDSQPYPKATALLLHRIKAEMIAERAAGDGDEAGAGCGSAALLKGSTPECSIWAEAGGVGGEGAGGVGVCAGAAAVGGVPFKAGGVFTAEAVLAPARSVLRSAAADSAPPLESQVDAILGALNLVLFLLLGKVQPGGAWAGGGAALSGASVAALRADVLPRLEARLRREMDAAWAEIAHAERHAVAGPGKGGQAPVEGARMAFTQLQVALVALERVLELAAEAAGSSG
jgi:hypothetical protein